MLGGVVRRVVDAHADGDVLVLRRRGDHHLARSRVDVALGPHRVAEEARRFDDDVDAEIPPRQPLRVPLGEHLDDVPVDGDAVSIGSNCPGKAAEDAVVLEQVGEHLGGGDVVDGDDLEIGGALSGGAQHVATDAAEAVDADSHSHAEATSSVQMPRRRTSGALPPYHRPRPPRRPGGGGGRPSPAGCSPARSARCARSSSGWRARSIGGLAHGGRQRLPAFGVGLEQGDRLELANACRRRPAQIGGLGVEAPVHAAADLADHPPGLEREAAGLRADRAQRGTHRGPGSNRDDPAPAAAPRPRADAERREIIDQLRGAALVGAADLEVGLAVGTHQTAGAEKRAAKPAPPAARRVPTTAAAPAGSTPTSTILGAPRSDHARHVRGNAVGVQRLHRGAHRNRTGGRDRPRPGGHERESLDERPPAARQQRRVRRELGCDALRERLRRCPFVLLDTRGSGWSTSRWWMVTASPSSRRR